jgi:hypothetical protein
MSPAIAASIAGDDTELKRVIAVAMSKASSG